MKMHHQQRDMQTRTWQMSFNDLLTVLLTFFILLVSLSNIHMNKVQGMSSSASDAFGSVARVETSPDSHAAFIKSIGTLEGINVHPVAGGISLVLPESLVYRSGSADIINKDLLRGLAEKLITLSGSIRIEGHTDNVPVAHIAFPSNWELSIQRAANVAKFLTMECGIDPRNVSAAGYADSRPVASNDSAEGRALNRRVQIIISLK
jgi:chemotaxis protein MotB